MLLYKAETVSRSSSSPMVPLGYGGGGGGKDVSGGNVVLCVGTVTVDPTHGVVFPLSPAPSLGVLGSVVESLLLGLGLLFLPDCLSSIVTPSSFSPKSFVGPISSCCVRALAC